MQNRRARATGYPTLPAQTQVILTRSLLHQVRATDKRQGDRNTFLRSSSVVMIKTSLQGPTPAACKERRKANNSSNSAHHIKLDRRLENALCQPQVR
eukprot:6179601-Pleurochrysis_carterae.AAC.2